MGDHDTRSALAAAAAAVAASLKALREELVTLRNTSAGWRPLPPSEQEQLFAGWRTRYPSRVAIPLARRDDSDDVLALVCADPAIASAAVVIVHDFATPGWELAGEPTSLRDWLASVRA